MRRLQQPGQHFGGFPLDAGGREAVEVGRLGEITDMNDLIAVAGGILAPEPHLQS